MAVLHECFRHGRRVLTLLAGVVVVTFWLKFASIAIHVTSSCDSDPPPNWNWLYQWEDNLPQHNLDLPFPEGKEGRYVYFANQVQQYGWNNQLNEVYGFVSILCTGEETQLLY